MLLYLKMAIYFAIRGIPDWDVSKELDIRAWR